MKLVLFPSLRGYRREFLRADAIAGATVWAVLVPEALAYAVIAGVPPVTGLYAAPAALLLYAAFGSSRHLVVGPMSATAALSAATVAVIATQGTSRFTELTIALAITAGVIGVVAGLARLGFVASLISEPVLKGFIVGLALTIIVGQLPGLLGVSGGSGDFFEKLWHVISQLGDANGPTVVVGLLSLAAVLGLRKAVPALPASLVVAALAIVAAHVFDLSSHGVDLVGHIDSGLPSLGLPNVAAHDYLDLAPGAIGIVLIGFAEGLGAAKTYAVKEHYEIDANRELLGLGAAGLGSGLSQGMVVNGSLSKTAVNGGAGAKTQLSGLIVAVLTVVTLLFLTAIFESLPEATLSAIVIAAVIELVDYRELARLYRVTSSELRRSYGIAARPDFIAAVGALVGVLVFDTLPGLFIGIGISLLLLGYRASHPHIALLGRVPGRPDDFGDIERRPENEVVPGVAIVRVEAGLFFANADAVRAGIRARAAEPGVRAIVLDAESTPFIDVTASNMLVELARDFERSNVQFVVARSIGGVRDVLDRSEPEAPPWHSYPDVGAAVEAVIAGKGFGGSSPDVEPSRDSP